MEIKTKIDSDLGQYLGHQDEIRVIGFSTDNQWMFSGSWDKRINIYRISHKGAASNSDSTTLSPEFSLDAHDSSITSLCLSQNKQALISGSKDGTIKIWDPQSGQCLNTLLGHKMKVFSVTCDNSYNYILSGGEDATVRVWKVAYPLAGKKSLHNLSFACEEILNQPQASVHVVKLNPSNSLFAAIGDEADIHLWEFPSCHYLPSLKGHRKEIYTLDFHPTLSLLLSGGRDKTIKMWNYQTHELQYSIQTSAEITKLSFNPEGSHFLAVDLDNDLTIYRTHDGLICHNHHIEEGKMLTVGISQDWSLLAVAPFQVFPPKIKIWAFDQKT
ncbi:hypothetical protein NEF87_001772 [Candidatus Lokiarchaeum ossiferum]|uniref:Uncharacterized protein n=1 Tax=Candidatus Lokiarchaeum ossiferum TaxID=2951803 RepID=A0ABY6HSX7_9ARCH|nr:hypothetical protein NEF87_001772 [Candidatus Lokiarchaeum sp. B-35]